MMVMGVVMTMRRVGMSMPLVVILSVLIVMIMLVVVVETLLFSAWL